MLNSPRRHNNRRIRRRVAGYFGGSTVAQMAAESQYAQVDLAVREKVEKELLQVVVR